MTAVEWSLSQFLLSYMYLCLGPMTYKVIWLFLPPHTHAEQHCNLITGLRELDNYQSLVTRAFVSLSI